MAKHTPESYVAKAVKSIADMVQRGPDVWKHFGPYWPQVQALIMRHQPELTQRVQQWGDPPDHNIHAAGSPLAPGTTNPSQMASE